MELRTKIMFLVTALVLTTGSVFVPSNVNAQSPTAVVRVECEGGYWGTITGDETQYVEHMGINEFQVSGDVIYVVLTKANMDDSELKATILVDGNERISRSTTEPNGELRFSYSLGSEDDDAGDGEGEKDEGGGFLCVSALLLSAVFLVGFFLMIASMKRK